MVAYTSSLKSHTLVADGLIHEWLKETWRSMASGSCKSFWRGGIIEVSPLGCLRGCASVGQSIMRALSEASESISAEVTAKNLLANPIKGFMRRRSTRSSPSREEEEEGEDDDEEEADGRSIL